MSRLLRQLVVLGAIAGPGGIAGGCRQPPPPELVASARFGVFFGGQIQERRDVPFELDEAKQTQGFRVDFAEPLTTDVDVEWRIDRPVVAARAAKRVRPLPAPAPEERTSSGKAVARAGGQRLDQRTPFRPGDPLGLWNVRVVVRGKVVIDRPFEVYDVGARQKARPVDGGT